MKKMMVLVIGFILTASLAHAATGLATNHPTAKRPKNQNSTPPPSTTSRIQVTDIGETSSSSPVTRIVPVFSVIMANLAGEDTSGENNRTGLAVGALVDVGYTDWVGETGAIYRQVGGSVTNAIINMNYLTIPLNAKYYFQGQKALASVYGKAGLMPSFLVDGSSTATNRAAGGPGLNFISVATDAGLGIKYSVSYNTSIIGEINYARGLTRISNDLTAYTSDFSLLAGLGIEL